MFGTAQGAGECILTFLVVSILRQSLWLTDMAHHHLAIAVISSGHQYRTNFEIGHSIKEMLNAKTSLALRLKVSSTSPRAVRHL